MFGYIFDERSFRQKLSLVWFGLVWFHGISTLPNQVLKKWGRKGLLCSNLLAGKRFVERIWFCWKFICRESSCSKKDFLEQFVERIWFCSSISCRGTVCRRNLVLLKFLLDFYVYIYRFSGFGLIHLFNGISTSYGLFNGKIWFILKCLIMIKTIFSTFPCNNF